MIEPESSIAQDGAIPNPSKDELAVCRPDRNLELASTVTLRAASSLLKTHSLLAPLAGGRTYLFIFEESQSRQVPLPMECEYVIGRADDAEVKVAGPDVSRRHAKLTVRNGLAMCVDLGSHNGTRVNGEPLHCERVIVSGDTISVGSVNLVYHWSLPFHQQREIGSPTQLRIRLNEELERSRLYHHPMTLVCLSFAADREINRLHLTQVLDKRLRIIDFAAWGSRPGRMWLLFPDLAAEDVVAQVHDLLPLLSLGQIRAGYAVFPSDGVDGDTLVCSSRAAAESTPWGTISCASSLSASRTVGGREIVLVDPAMVRIYEQVQRIARSDLSVLIHGETGVGKELVARALHEGSARKDKCLVALSCAAFVDGLLESELFGHERGSFTGAVAQKLGQIERADGGTLFLDEVAELSLSAQAKLLRVLEERKVLRLGGTKERDVDIRIVAASHQNLDHLVAKGAFRRDLLYRLRGACITIPPLRERPRELPILARRFLHAFCEKLNRTPLAISHDAMEQLLSWSWPGNVRELRNAMEYVAATADTIEVQPWHLPSLTVPAQDAADPRPSEPRKNLRPLADELRDLEISRMKQALEEAEGVQLQAAKLLQMPERTFYMKAKQYGLIQKSNTAQVRVG